MALNLQLLTTRAECDEALDNLAAELDGYQHRDGNLDYADRQAGRTATDVAGRLAGVQAEIDSYTTTLAQPNLPAAMRRQFDSKLRRATDRKDNLDERGQARTGAAAFLAGVDADQIAAQVTILTDAQRAVSAHKATLPA